LFLAKEERVVTESDLFMEALGTSRPAARPKHKISKTLNGTKSEAKPIAETEGKSASTQNTNISNQPQNKNLDKLSNNNFKVIMMIKIITIIYEINENFQKLLLS